MGIEAVENNEALHGLRELTELSASLSTLEATNQNLQSQLRARCKEIPNKQTAAIKTALVLSRANSRLRARLADAFENKRQQLIRAYTGDAESLSAQLENAFQMDWFACGAERLNNESVADADLLETLGGLPALESLQKWDLDQQRRARLEQAIHASLRTLEGDADTLDTSSGKSSPASTTSSRQTASEPFSAFMAKSDRIEKCFEYGFGNPEDHSVADPTVHPFDEEFDDRIVVTQSSNGNEEIKCGSLDKLIERLTDDRYQDLNLRFVFLLTYHSFTTPAVFLDKLVQRFFMPDPPNSTPSELEFFRQNRQKGIRLKVFSVLKKWVEDHFSDFEEDEELRNRLKSLLHGRLANAAWSCKLTGTILSVLAKQESGVTRTTPLAMNCPPPAIRNTMSLQDIRNNAMDMPSLEFARQLCIADFEMFRQIRPRECLNQAWSKSYKDTAAPNIMRMIRRFNHVSHWTQSSILFAETNSARLVALKKFIRIAEYCLGLNNFASACAIFSGLEATPVHRLKKLWEQLGSKHRTFFETLQSMFRHDTKSKMRFRTTLQEAIPPCIPHLGLFLSDLTFIEDGNPDHLHEMINFLKRRKLSERIMWIKQYQQAGYQLQRVQVVHDYFEQVLRPHDDDGLWKRSKEIHP